MRALVFLLAVSACDGTSPQPDAEARPTRLLGMNDITLLVPLPTEPSEPVLVKLDFDHDTMVERSMFVSFVIAADMAPKTDQQLVMGDYHVVAVRFDLCDRGVTPCEAGADGRLRLVLQPIYTREGAPAAHDIGVHLFFPIPAADLPAVIDELRRLAALQDAPLDAPLMVNPALAAGNQEYASRLRALIETYATRDTLARFTTLGQERGSGAFAWVMRGMERHGDQLVLVPIPEMGLLNFKQTALLAGGDVVFDVRPLAPSPPALATALNGQVWATASTEERTAAIDALLEISNPRLRANPNTQCVGCHVATYLAPHRAMSAGIDPTTLPSHFTSARDTTVGGVIATDPRVVRGLGWAAGLPVISQRVANETAVVLEEIEARYPPPQP